MLSSSLISSIDVWVRGYLTHGGWVWEYTEDRVQWFRTSLDWLDARGYEIVDPKGDFIEDGSVYNMQGEPISQSVQAVEAKPKYVPPLFEEREV